jgi:hypothetical protein
MLKRLIVAASVLLICASGASAYPSSGSVAFETTLTGPLAFAHSGEAFSVSIPFSLPGFDPAWGTLEEVWLLTYVSFSGAATFTNPDTVPWPASARLRLLGAIQGDGWRQVVDEYFDVGSWELTPPGGSQTIHFNWYAGNPFIGPGGAIPAFVTSGLVPAEFGAALGAVDAYAGWLPDIENAQVDSLSVRVEYNYSAAETPVPEPATGLLLGLGAAGLIARKRRARRE